MYHKFLQYDSLNYVAKSFDVDEGENIEMKYKWLSFVWDEVELEHKIILLTWPWAAKRLVEGDFFTLGFS